MVQERKTKVEVEIEKSEHFNETFEDTRWRSYLTVRRVTNGFWIHFLEMDVKTPFRAFPSDWLCSVSFQRCMFCSSQQSSETHLSNYGLQCQVRNPQSPPQTPDPIPNMPQTSHSRCLFLLLPERSNPEWKELCDPLLNLMLLNSHRSFLCRPGQCQYLLMSSLSDTDGNH